MIHAQIIHAALKAVPDIRPHLSPQALKAADLGAINAAYSEAIFDALMGYFGGGSITASRNAMKRAATEAFGAAFEAGWEDGGGELPFDGDALTWFNARLEQEFGFIEQLFDEAKELRKNPDFDYLSFSASKAESYTNTLRQIHNEAQVRVRDNVMVTFELGNTEKHCKSCLKLNGQRHKLSWFVSHGYVPPHGENLDCSAGGHCDCKLKTDKGEIITA